MVPQLSPTGQVVFAVQPQTLAVPPPLQVWGSVQAGPHVTVPLQPSGMVPQLSPGGHDVFAVHDEHVSSVVFDAVFRQLPPMNEHCGVVEHCTHASYFRFVASVSQCGAAPLHPVVVPSSTHVHFRQPAGLAGVVVVHTGGVG
jgi:hypothetical protein